MNFLKKFKKYILLGIFVALTVTTGASAASVLQPFQGGTGISTATSDDVGKFLKVSDDSPFTYVLDTADGVGGAVDSVFGRIGTVIAVAGDYTTDLVTEATNLYFTNERVDDRAAALIQNGTGITWSYNDGAGTLTPTVTITQYTDELAQDAVGAMVDSTLVYVDGTPLLTRAALTGDVTASQASNATTIASDAVTNAKLANMATQTFKGRTTAGTGDPEDLTVVQVQALLGTSGTNTGDVTLSGQNYLSIAGQVITVNSVDLSTANATGVLAAGRFPALTGDVTTSAGALAATIPSDTVTFAKMQNIATQRLLGRSTGGSGDIEEIAIGSGLSLSAGTLTATGAVTSVANEDGTMIVSPTTGEVVVGLNQEFDFRFTGAISFGGSADFTRLPTSSDTVTASNELTTKEYVDTLAQGLQYKGSVTAKTTAALPASTYNNGAGTITGNANGALAAQDGITLTVNQKLLVNDQASSFQNGIYDLTTVGDAGKPFVLTRATNFDIAAEITQGSFVSVLTGTVNANTVWAQNSSDMVTLGTDAITFTQLSSPTVYTASLGVQLVGNDFRANLDAAGALTLSGNKMGVNVDGTSIEISSNALRIKSPVSLANGGLGVALADPNADRIAFWDDSLGSFEWLTVGSGLTISGTTLSATTGSGHVIQEEGSNLTQRTSLNFVGSGITATDDSGADATDITLDPYLEDIAEIDVATDFGFLYASNTDAAIITRTIGGGTSVSVSNPESGNIVVDLTGAVGAINSAGGGFGFLAYNGSGVMNYRELTAGTGIGITNERGVAGSPTITNNGVTNLSSPLSTLSFSGGTGSVDAEVNTTANFSWTGQHIFGLANGLIIADAGNILFMPADASASKLLMENDQNVGTPTNILFRSDNYTNFVEFSAATGMSTDISYKWPVVDVAGIWKSDGSGNLSIGDADLTTDVTGILPEANGGTGKAYIPAESLVGHRASVHFFNEFLGNPTTTGDGQIRATISGTNAGTGNVTGVGGNAYGIGTASTGTTATGRSVISTGTNGAVYFNAGTWVYENRIQVPVLSTGAQRFQVLAGFFDVNTSPNQTDGVYFLYDEGGVSTGSAASANWQIVTASNSTRTFTTTATAVPVSTFVTLRIEVNAAGTLATFYVNGVSVGTSATNIPVGASRQTGFGLGIFKSIGTTITTLYTDYMYVHGELTTTR